MIYTVQYTVIYETVVEAEDMSDAGRKVEDMDIPSL